jgi:tetratricopeptide (TPR) repeat protein
VENCDIGDPHASRETLETELEALQERLRAGEDSVRLRLRLGWLLGRLERPAEAVPHFRAAREAAPEDPWPWFYLAAALGKSEAAAEGRVAYARMDRLAPEDAVWLARRCRVLRLLGEPARALEMGRRALEAGAEPEVRVWVHRSMATCHEALGDEEARLAELEAAVAAGPEDVRAQKDLGFCYGDRRDYAAALPHFDKAAALAPNDADAWFGLGAIAARLGQYEKALNGLERSIALDPDRFESRRDLGGVLNRFDRHAEAVPHLERALELAVSDAERFRIHSHLGFACAELKQNEKALQHYRTAAELDPDDPQAEWGVGATWAYLKGDERALAHLRVATELGPDEAGAWYARGAVAARAGELQEAQGALEKAIALRHPGGRARAQLAWVYQQQGRKADALEQARKALKQPLPRKWRAWVDGIIRQCRR